MAIRKDLDDMLNSLKKGGIKSEPAKKQAEAPTAPKRKSVYDSMSVDDLLSALSDDKKTDKADELAEEISEEFSGEIKPEPVTMTEEMNVVHSTTAKEVTFTEDINVIKSTTAEEPAAPAPKKKRIVISGELPDYEAIRQRELEKDRLAKEQAEREAREAAERAAKEQAEREAREAAERAAKEQAEREAREAAERAVKEKADREAREAAERAAREKAEREAREAAELAEESEKRKKSFFSKLKEKLNADDAFDETEEQLEPENAPEAAEPDELDSLIAEAEAEAAENAYESIEEPEETEPVEEISEPEEAQPSADELLDAALAAIHSTELVEDEAPAEETANEDASEEEETPEAEDTDTETDPVDSMIEGMREDAENAIAELDKPKAEEQPEPEAETETEEAAEEKQEEPAEPEKKNVFAKILEEDPDELLNVKRESPEADEAPEVVEKKKFKRNLYAVLGAVFAVFAIIGIVVVGAKLINSIRSFTSGEVKKDGFTEIVYPAVIMDIESFNSPSELSSEQMITASIWSIIMDDSRVSKYTVNPGTDTISIPYMDVEARAVEMFGTDHPEFEHCTVGPVDSRFFYSEGAYNVKLKPITFTYSPEIKSIVKSGSEYTVSVDYVDELPSWMEKSVSKSVEFKLTEREDGTYRIDSMKINYVKSNI